MTLRRIGVLGRTRQGKSSFINALLNRPDFLPSGPTLTTSASIAVKFGQEGHCSVHTSSRQRRSGMWADLRALCVADAQVGGEKAVSATVLVADPRVRDLAIVDLPGSDAVDPSHVDVWTRAIRRCDALIFVFRLEQSLGAQEEALVREWVDDGRRLLAVFGNAVRPAEVEASEWLRNTRRQVVESEARLRSWNSSPFLFSALNFREAALMNQGQVVFAGLLRQLKGGR